jgi:LDH2 family malate/lactate/ureidoglycolate dehydrogenase
MDGIIRDMKNAPKAQGAERIYLPGEMEWEKRAVALKQGMLLPKDVILRLMGLSEDLGIDLRTLLRK